VSRELAYDRNGVKVRVVLEGGPSKLALGEAAQAFVDIMERPRPHQKEESRGA
jgi:hypothetical protein